MESGFDIELHSERTNTTPSLSKIKNCLKKYGIRVNEKDIFTSLDALSDEEFNSHILDLHKSRHTMDAKSALRVRYRLSLKDASLKLETLEKMYRES